MSWVIKSIIGLSFPPAAEPNENASVIPLPFYGDDSGWPEAKILQARERVQKREFCRFSGSKIGAHQFRQSELK
jgi:hypothetical protein